MAQRVGQTLEHLGGIYHRFTALSARYWWLYVLAVVLYELVLDRALGWLNAKVDETGVAFIRYVVGEVVYSPMILVIIVMLVLLVWAVVTAAPSNAVNSTAEEEETAGPARSTDWVGLYWRAMRVNLNIGARAMCPQHTNTRLLYTAEGKEPQQIPLADPAGYYPGVWSLLCSADESHTVPLDGNESFNNSDFYAARRIAVERLRADG